jgi:tetratricopeptide (TPR) repeat protein
MLAGVWVAALALALISGAWVREREDVRRRDEGVRLGGLVEQLAEQAREAAGEGNAAGAAALLEQALALFPELGGAPVALLLDLASLAVHADPEFGRDRARELLAVAWEREGLAEPLRARIAKDRGALELLAGDVAAAQEWYEEARVLDPSGEGARREVLRRTAGGGSAHEP